MNGNTLDIHNYEKQLEAEIKNLLKSELAAKNKELIQSFVKDMSLMETTMTVSSTRRTGMM